MTTPHSVLITGGSRGIGFGLAQRFRARGDRVLITGRSRDSLHAVERELPGLLTAVGDVGDAAERERLAAVVAGRLPELDIVVNNAGIQRRVSLAEDDAPWPERQREFDILLSGPVHLNTLLIPLLLEHGRPATIVDVSSGGALIPQPFAPLYSAAKAAIHSYTTTLRHALAHTNVAVLELMPPAVATALVADPHGVDVDAFCDAALAGILERRPIIGFGATDTEPIRQRLRAEQQAFDASSTRFEVVTYQ